MNFFEQSPMMIFAIGLAAGCALFLLVRRVFQHFQQRQTRSAHSHTSHMPESTTSVASTDARTSAGVRNEAVYAVYRRLVLLRWSSLGLCGLATFAYLNQAPQWTVLATLTLVCGLQLKASSVRKELDRERSKAQTLAERTPTTPNA